MNTASLGADSIVFTLSPSSLCTGTVVLRLTKNLASVGADINLFTMKPAAQAAHTVVFTANLESSAALALMRSTPLELECVLHT